MSQRALEAALGRLICDKGFRLHFWGEPQEALARANLLLSPVELACLRKMDGAALDRFAERIDDRVRTAMQSPSSEFTNRVPAKRKRKLV